MAEIKWLSDTGEQNVIDDNAALTDGSRAAGDYDNGTELDVLCDVWLTVQYDGGPPTAGDLVADLYVMPSQPDDTTFPEGGDAALGTDDDPQAIFLVGSFESVNPSTTVNEVLCIPMVRLYPHDNRFVVKNTSGQTFDLTWQLDIVPHKTQVV